MENKLDEHELLRVQLEALEYQEKHGVLLTEGDFYYRHPQSFDPAIRLKAEGAEGQPEWSLFRQPSATGVAITNVIPAGGAPLGGPHGAPAGGMYVDQEADTQSRWQSWLLRQRKRGWYASTTLVYSTLFGAVVGASNFSTYWDQLQMWRGSMFFVPYLVFLFMVGLPSLQLEVSGGALYI